MKLYDRNFFNGSFKAEPGCLGYVIERSFERDQESSRYSKENLMLIYVKFAILYEESEAKILTPGKIIFGRAAKIQVPYTN